MVKDRKKSTGKSDFKVLISKDGPYLVSGGLSLGKEIVIIGQDGQPETWQAGESYPRQENYALCRCGNSRNMPYCDGSHTTSGFDGTETASRKKYIERASMTTGPAVDLTDAQDLCAGARFCHKAGGTWANVKKSDDPKARDVAVQSACNCPAGRLVAWDKTSRDPIEPVFTPSISLTEDPQAKASGPIWLKGNIPFESADGYKYETRNRVTLCRCGRSGRKPYCDGTHVSIKFTDGDQSLGTEARKAKT